MRKLAIFIVILGLTGASFGCSPGSKREPVRPQDDPTALLFPHAGFEGLSPSFSGFRVEVDAKSLDSLGDGWKDTYLKQWSSSAGTVREEVQHFQSEKDAAEGFDHHDPRRKSVELSTGNLVTASRPFNAPGHPEESQVHCGWADDGRQQTRRCAFWAWWARYGQYTIKIEVGTPSEPLRIIDEQDFERIVLQVATHAASVLSR